MLAVLTPAGVMLLMLKSEISKKAREIDNNKATRDLYVNLIMSMENAFASN